MSKYKYKVAIRVHGDWVGSLKTEGFYFYNTMSDAEFERVADQADQSAFGGYWISVALTEGECDALLS